MTKTRRGGAALVAASILVLAGCAGHKAASPAETTGAGKTFADPRAAVDALLAACRNHDEAAIVAIFGPESKPVVSTGNTEADHERCERLVAVAGQMMRLDPIGPDRVQLVLGNDDWPFPIPLVKNGKQWHFDPPAGMQEMRSRRIGADEIDAIDVCREYVRAQQVYQSKPRVGRERAYAQNLISTSGTKDGLYSPSTSAKDASPLGPLAASPTDGTKSGRPDGAWSGYRFRILTAQGGAAPGGQKSYVEGGRMTRGFALVAYPAMYGATGIMTFIVGPDGQIFQADLGEQTDAVAGAMTAYDPDSSWKRVAS